MVVGASLICLPVGSLDPCDITKASPSWTAYTITKLWKMRLQAKYYKTLYEGTLVIDDNGRWNKTRVIRNQGQCRHKFKKKRTFGRDLDGFGQSGQKSQAGDDELVLTGEKWFSLIVIFVTRDNEWLLGLSLFSIFLPGKIWDPDEERYVWGCCYSGSISSM